VKAWTVSHVLLIVELLGSSGFCASVGTHLDSAGQVMSSSTAVEPSPWLMLLGGLGLLWMLMRFRRHRTD